MSRRVIELIIDDLDGSEGAATRIIPALRIDLTDDNYDKLMQVLAPYIAAGQQITGPASQQRVKGTRSSVGSSATSTTQRRKEENDKIRVWARAHGHTVSDRGRIHGDVVKAYEAAHNGATPAPTAQFVEPAAATTEDAVAITRTKDGLRVDHADGTSVELVAKPEPEPTRTELGTSAPTSVIRSWWKDNAEKLSLPEWKGSGGLPGAVKQAYAEKVMNGSANGAEPTRTPRPRTAKTTVTA
jgi:hypothetical protein